MHSAEAIDQANRLQSNDPKIRQAAERELMDSLSEEDRNLMESAMEGYNSMVESGELYGDESNDERLWRDWYARRQRDIAAHLGVLRAQMAVCAAPRAHGLRFKSSREKKNASLAYLPTNLHAQVFSVTGLPAGRAAGRGCPLIKKGTK